MADRCEEAREEFSSSQERREVPVVSEAGEPSRPSQTVPPPVMPVPQGARADEDAAFRAQLLAGSEYIFTGYAESPLYGFSATSSVYAAYWGYRNCAGTC